MDAKRKRFEMRYKENFFLEDGYVRFRFAVLELELDN
jgi:hypothetical protein